MWTVYKHTAPNGKVYIGITMRKPEKRWANGNGYKHNKHFYNAILEYDWKNIRHDILETGLTKQQACAKEIELIAKYDATNPKHGYNNSIGGEYGTLGVHPSAETRKKMSEANKGKHHSAEARKKMSESRKGRIPWNKGVHLSAETRRKLSEAQKGKHHLSPEMRRKLSESRKGANNPNYGKHPSAESRRKMSESTKGVNHPNYGKHLSAETRQKIGESQAKAVI